MPTGDTTEGLPPSVSPAQVITSHATISPAPDAVSSAVNAELRIRNLQSSADKAAADAQKALRDKQELEQRLAAMEAQQKAVLEGATQSVQELRAAFERERAERIKAQILTSHPELVRYAAFIPASTDESHIQTVVTQLKTIRDADMAEAKAAYEQQFQAAQPTPAQPATPAPAQPNDYYPRGSMPAIPPLQPTRPAPGVPGSGGAADQAATIMAEALASGNAAAVEAAAQRVADMAKLDWERSQGAGR